MELREPVADDCARIRELVESAMMTTYRLSPQQIDALTADRFSNERLTDVFEDHEHVSRVVETTEAVEGSVVVGYAGGTVGTDTAELRWLFVDPEHRGKGIGTELFEAALDELDDRAGSVQVTTLEANTEGNQFAERFGFERVDEQRIEVGGESLVEHVHETSAETESTDTSDASRSEPRTDALPGVEERGDETIATVEESGEVILDRESAVSGTEGPFVPAYEDSEQSDRFGFYCGNCGSVDASMDQMGRIECAACGNTHAPKTSGAYDGSYL